MDEQRFENEYRTGRTQPQKNRNGLIAFLLILVIFLCGIVSALSLLNIRLFRQLQQKDTLLSFSQGEQPPVEADTLTLSLEGMTVQELPTLYQQLYNLPQGLYICHVTDGSEADNLGIAPGAVLISFGDTPVYQLDTLQALQKNYAPGESVALSVHQAGRTGTYTLKIGE